MTPRGNARMHGGEARRKGEQGGHPLCRGSTLGQGGHEVAFMKTSQEWAMGSKLSRDA